MLSFRRSYQTRYSFTRKVVDDIVYEVDGKLISVKEGDVDIGDCPFLRRWPFDDLSCNPSPGANPSAEEQEESLESNEEKIINIIHSNRLSKTTFDKKSYLSYLKVKPSFLRMSKPQVSDPVQQPRTT